MANQVVIWKQGASFPQLGKKIIQFNHQINPGPSDERVRIAGFEVLPDSEGNFVSGNGNRSYSEDELDAIQTFGLVRYVVDLYEKTLGRPIPWSWEKDGLSVPITVNIRKNDIHARYLKHAKCIDLDFYGPYGKWTYYCRSVDIVAHETGHAILDALKPDWENGDPETRGMAESFCDLAAMFVVTSQFDLCEEVLRETNGDLKKENILTQFGVGYGLDNPNKPIRSAINSRKYEENLNFTYDYAAVLTGCLYDILADIINQKSRTSRAAEYLFEKAQKWQSAIVKTFDCCSTPNSCLSEFYEILSSILYEEKSLIARQFKVRNIPC
jgi:hypothetical protein